MTHDDYIYAIMLLISIFFGRVLYFGQYKWKQNTATFCGIVITTAVCRLWIWHSLLTTVVSITILRNSSKRYVHILCFIWCFGYLAFFRTAHYFGFEKPPSHSNAVQLLLTLKLVSLAFDICDTWKSKCQLKKTDLTEEEKLKTQLELKYKAIDPSAIEMFHYAYSYIGILTGPFYRYRTYYDGLRQDDIKVKDYSYEVLWTKIRDALIPGVIYLIASHYYYIEYGKDAVFFEQPLWYRLYYMVFMFATWRMRMYFAFLASECVCMSAGIGAYPVASAPRCGCGPTNLEALDKLEVFSQKTEVSAVRVEYNFVTINNISIYACEWACTTREAMKGWNMSVQFWLAYYIYRRVPLKSIRTVITMLVSAYWHGIHPGYYLSFLTVPFVLAAEASMANLMDRPATRRLYLWTAWLYKMRCLEYMGMGFLLLGFYETINFWASIGFLVHSLVVFFVLADLVGRFVVPRSPRNANTTPK